MVLRVFENGKQEWLTLRELFEQCKVCIELTGYDFKVKKNKQYNRIYRYSRLKDTIIPSIFVVEEIIPEAKKEDVVCENIRVQQEPTKNEKLKNSVIEVLSNHKEVTCYSSEYINGYYTRTIFEERILKKEIIIKVLVVYMDAESSEIVQVNVDVENLYGGLLETSCFDGKDFNEIADEVVHFACVGEN